MIRWTTLLIFICCLHVSARTYSQQITLQVKNAPLASVLKTIRKQSGINIIGRTELLNKALPVSADIQNIPLNKALEICFRNQPLTYDLIENTIVLKLKNNVPVNPPPSDSSNILIIPPVQIIQGKVTDSSGKPLVGVTVNVKGTKTGTATDNNGNFSFSNIDPDKSILIFSYIGYEQQTIALNGQKNITVIMQQAVKDLDSLGLVINTGYQTLKPNETNGSYVVIDNKALNRQTGTNILQRLNGVTSSLLFNVGKHNNNPQNTTGITIRGLSTINGPLDPLIVVDNFIYDGNINNINPNDVENVTVLKDAAAASIWGARAGNGVIVITTKRGRFNQKLQVDFNTDIILNSKPNLYYFPEVSPADYIDYQQFLFGQGYYNKQFTSYMHPAIPPAVQVFEDAKNGLISASDSAAAINAMKQYDSRTQFMKYYDKEGILQQYALNLRGGSNNISWLVSGTYDKDIDNLQAKNNKINLRFENTYMPLKNLTVNAGVYYTNSNNRSGLPDYNDVTTLNGNMQIPYLNIAGPNGASIAVPHSYNTVFTDTAGGGRLMDWHYYPLEEYKHYYFKTNIEELLAHISAEYKITDGLDVELMYQYQKQRTETTTFGDTASYYVRNLINTFSQIDPSTGIIKYNFPLGGFLSKVDESLNSYNFRGQLNFNRTYGNHRIIALAGFEVRNEWSGGNSATYYNYNQDPLTYTSSLDFADYFPTYFGDYQYLPNGTAIEPVLDNRFVSIFANGSYTYHGKYTFSASIRKDGSNIFGANTNDKWKPLWSAGLGWDLSKEKFYHITWLPFLKISATYGVSGNVDLTKTALPVGLTNVYATTGLRYISINQINNPDLSWEKSYQTNYKIEFAITKNILSGSVEYYRKKGTNLYAPTPYDYTTWGVGSTITANVADMSGNGVDVMVNTVNINRKLKWTTNFLLNYNTNKTTAYYSQTATSLASFIGTGSTTITPIIGKPLYAIAAYKWGGLDEQGNPRGYLHDTLSEDYTAIIQSSLNDGLKGGSFKYIGSANPTYFGSLMNSFSYEGFELSFNLMYKFGYYFLKPSLGYSGLAVTDANDGGDYAKRWLQPGDEKKTNVPSFAYPLNSNRDALYARSEINVLRGDHIRLQFINLSYSLFRGVRNLPFKSLELYFNAANIGIIWSANKYHIDPDFVNAIPDPKIYTIGIRAGL